MDTTILAALGGFYLLGLPLVLRLSFVLLQRLQMKRYSRRLEKNRALAKTLEQPVSPWPKLWGRMKFSLRDKRPVQLGKRTMGGSVMMLFWGLWALGLVCFLAAGATSMWWLLGLGSLLFFTAVVYAMQASKGLLETRQKVIERMFTIGNAKLGISQEFKDNPAAVINVLEWQDLVKPVRVEFTIPDTFSAEGGESFLRQFNQIFGVERTWVPADDPENGVSGWDFENGKATFFAVPPLPTMAPWKAHYVESPGIAWSFFPIGLGVENGVQLPNPETGEAENIIGFDVSGLQVKEGSKAGLNVSPRITTSPMVLCAGGTGGGKSLNVIQPVMVKRVSNSVS